MEFEDNYFYKSTDVAKYLVAMANEKRISINMTKTQKLLYIVYSVFLRAYEKRLLNEHPQAWPYGPVFPTTRNKLLKKDLIAITEKDIEDEEYNRINQDEKLKNVLDFVFDNFGTWSAGQLSEWSHTEGSPWEKTKNKKGFKWGDIIPDAMIYEYFRSIINIKPET